VLDNTGWDIKYEEVKSTGYSKLFTFTTLDASKDDVHFAVVNDIHGRNEVLKSLVKHVETRDLDFMVFNGEWCRIFNRTGILFKSRQFFY
jgi:hypothetical protein